MLEGADMVFITTGMGGGTGTGAAPIIAEVAKEMGILTVAVVTRPFPFEGRKRMQIADEGIRALAESVDSLITIPNEKLLTILGKDASLLAAFAKADDVLAGAVRGISDIIKRPGMINVDFADVKTVMSEMGMAMMGTGCASGPNRAREATEAAIRNPLLEDVNLQRARHPGEHHRGSGPVPGRVLRCRQHHRTVRFRARHCEGGHRDRRGHAR